MSVINVDRGGKSPTISFIRMLAMLSIIACHFCQYYDNEWAWWLNVGVQVFFLLSGYLYGNKDIADPIGWLIRQFTKILVPYYLFLIPTIISYLFAAPESLEAPSVVGCLFTVRTIKGIEHLWFVSAILFCYIVTPYLAAFRNYILQKTLIKQVCLIFALFLVVTVVGVWTNSFFPGNICCYMLGFFISVFAKKYGSKVINILFLLSIVPCIASNTIYIFLKYFKEIEMHGPLSHITSYSHMFLALSLVTLLMIIFKKIKACKIFEWSDNYSYEVYIVHQYFILSPFTLLTLTYNKSLNILIALLVIFFSGYILGILNKKIYSLFSRVNHNQN